MSTNDKNVIRKAYMRNFTTKKKHRYILTENGSELDFYVQNNLKIINENINMSIQELSIRIEDRQIPYIVVENFPVNLESISIKDMENDRKAKRIRGMIRDIKTGTELIKKLERELKKDETMASHSIEFFAHTAYNELTFSNNSFDAKVLLDNDGLKTIFTDIFLDSAIFNSYSFLKEMSDKEKQAFGKKKLEFYQKRDLSCFYRLDCEDEDKLLYYSLAFSCRKSVDEFDFDGYISLWNEFIAEYYPNEKHVEKNVSEQLKQHVDYGQLPNDLRQKIMKKGEGAYLILRINHNRTDKLYERIRNYFGGYDIGKIKIVRISEYYKIDDMLKNLDVSAYKVIRPQKKNRG